MDSTAKANATSITIYDSASCMYVSCWLYVCTQFTDTWWIISMLVYAYGFMGWYGLYLYHIIIKSKYF